MVRRRPSLQEAGEAPIWPLLECDNSMMVPVPIRLCKSWDWEEELSCVLKHCQALVLQTEGRCSCLCRNLQPHGQEKMARMWCEKKPQVTLHIQNRGFVGLSGAVQLAFRTEIHYWEEGKGGNSLECNHRWQVERWQQIPACKSLCGVHTRGRPSWEGPLQRGCSCFMSELLPVLATTSLLLEKLAHTGQALFRNTVVSLLKE